MTMQIAIEARDGFVLASDTKIRNRADHVGVRAVSDEILSQSKVCISKRHNVAVGVSGVPHPEANPIREFADFISELESVPEDFGEVIDQWVSQYQKRYGPDWAFVLLIVNPASQHSPIWRLEVSTKVISVPGRGYWVNGNETNSAIMWPEFYKCDETPPRDLNTAVNVAALTILTGQELNPSGVSGLEIWKYTGTWRRADRAEILAIADRFGRLKQDIDRFIHAAPSNSARLQT